SFPEQWDVGGSQMHSSYLFIGAWFLEGVAGIAPAPGRAGMQRFVIRPMLDAEPKLDHAAVCYDSLYGRIGCAWTRKDRHVVLTVTVPPNSAAELELPPSLRARLTEGGGVADKARGVKPAPGTAERLTLLLASGTYRFEVQ
ncbi:MAG TPA: alpha-L-rhamnosidase C-terminal domain-containing protein, partial [Chthonomonadaceae bacterium]|nr:alpha-L-rhamnosidase C-terminal domain-containing protein [Chthonomonadaceae bacterium]